MNWYLQSIKNYTNFKERARRLEYWMFILFNAIFMAVFGVIDGLINIKLFSSLYSIFILIPAISLQFRRLHDIDKSAWWLLISLVPVAGMIVLFVFSVKDGTKGINQYGNDPKNIANNETVKM